jgi:CheY-like chemotaxis protein
VEAALAVVAESSEALHAVLCDVGMPGRDGYEFARALRALPAEQGGRLPLLAVTAFARGEDRTRALLAGFNAHLAKPVDGLELVAVVASLGGRLGGASR